MCHSDASVYAHHQGGIHAGQAAAAAGRSTGRCRVLAGRGPGAALASLRICSSLRSSCHALGSLGASAWRRPLQACH